MEPLRVKSSINCPPFYDDNNYLIEKFIRIFFLKCTANKFIWNAMEFGVYYSYLREKMENPPMKSNPTKNEINLIMRLLKPTQRFSIIQVLMSFIE